MLLNLDKNIIKQDWILLQEKETPFVVVDNWYTKNELKLLWKELDFFTQKMEKMQWDITIEYI